MKLIIEQAKTGSAGTVMGLLAKSATDLGHEVIRWNTHEFNRAVELEDVDLSFFWFGDEYFRQGVRQMMCHRYNKKPRPMLSVGPSVIGGQDCFEVDPRGLGPLSSREFKPSLDAMDSPKAWLTSGPTVVVLQSESSRGMVYENPWFDGNADFLRFLDKNSQIDMLVRPTGCEVTDRAIDVVVRDAANIRWMTQAEVKMPIKHWSALVTINSPIIHDALMVQMPVMCYGVSVWRRKYAVYCMDNESEATISVTRTISRSRQCASPLIRSVMRELVEFVKEGVWDRYNVPYKMAETLEAFETQEMMAA